MTNLLIALSSILVLTSYIVYIVAIFRGKARPHRTTRFVLVLITGLSTASLIAQGSTVAVWLPAVSFLGCLVIFALSVKHGMGGWSKMDILCLLIALFGIVIWRMTSSPIYALFASIIADLFGQIPMLIKTFRFPKTEVWTFYFLGVLAPILSALAITHRTYQELSYPLYIIFINSLTVIFILRKKIALKFK